jgi:hypothetical protein
MSRRICGRRFVSILCETLKRRLPASTVVFSPDARRLNATEYTQNLNTSMILLHKTRETGAKAHVARTS